MGKGLTCMALNHSSVQLCMALRVLYVHGLESGANGFKARYLAKYFKECFCAPMINSRKGLWCVHELYICSCLQVESFSPKLVSQNQNFFCNVFTAAYLMMRQLDY